MEVDTGSAKSVIGKSTYDKYFTAYKLHSEELLFATSSKQEIHLLGYVMVPVQFMSHVKELRLYVVPFSAVPLFGRAWCTSFRVNLSNIHKLAVPMEQQQPQPKISEILSRYADVFAEDLGTVRGVQASLKVKPNVRPVFCKARPVSFARRQQISAKLRELEEAGIIERVDHREWAAPLVTPVKADGSLCICGDFKVTINSQLEVDKYPLPKIEEIFACLGGGDKFTTLDLKNAYLQMEVREEDQKFLTVNTHQGLYRYRHLVYSVASAPAIWQQMMDQVLQGLPGTQCN